MLTFTNSFIILICHFDPLYSPTHHEKLYPDGMEHANSFNTSYESTDSIDDLPVADQLSLPLGLLFCALLGSLLYYLAIPTFPYIKYGSRCLIRAYRWFWIDPLLALGMALLLVLLVWCAFILAVFIACCQIATCIYFYYGLFVLGRYLWRVTTPFVISISRTSSQVGVALVQYAATHLIRLKRRVIRPRVTYKNIDELAKSVARPALGYQIKTWDDGSKWRA